VQGIYDSHRDLYYFTDTNKIQVFSRTQGKWLSPIPIPSPGGAAQRLWSLALSPDGSKLAISDASASVIYLLNPANPSAVSTLGVGSQLGTFVYPAGVAVSDSGVVYFATFVIGISGARQFFNINTNTSTITDYGIAGPGGQDTYLRAAISSDNARVYFNDQGYVFSVDTATDKIFNATINQGCCYGDYELTLASNQTQLSASSYLYDTDLNGQSYYSLNDREILNTTYVYGAKFSPDGRLLFQPTIKGVDLLDGRVGNLLERISLPVSLSPQFDALVSDGKDNILVALLSNGSGIMVIDLTSIVEPSFSLYDHAFWSQANLAAGLGARWWTRTKPAKAADAQRRQVLRFPRPIKHDSNAK